MSRREYAMLSNPASGTDGVTYSHVQPDTIVQEFSLALGRGLKAERSNPRFLHVNMSHTNIVTVSGLLGERGWELAGYSTLSGGHEYAMFKRQLPGA